MDINELTKKYFILEKTMNKNLKEFDLTYHQWLVAREIYYTPNFLLNSAKIAENLHQDKRTTSLIIKKLYINNIIDIYEDGDKRNKLLALTDYGLLISAEITEIEEFVSMELEINS